MQRARLGVGCRVPRACSRQPVVWCTAVSARCSCGVGYRAGAGDARRPERHQLIPGGLEGPRDSPASITRHVRRSRNADRDRRTTNETMKPVWRLGRLLGHSSCRAAAEARAEDEWSDGDVNRLCRADNAGELYGEYIRASAERQRACPGRRRDRDRLGAVAPINRENQVEPFPFMRAPESPLQASRRCADGWLAVTPQEPRK